MLVIPDQIRAQAEDLIGFEGALGFYCAVKRGKIDMNIEEAKEFYKEYCVGDFDLVTDARIEALDHFLETV